MSTQIQRRRGTTAEHSTFTGVEGEITVDTTKDTAVVHDGTTVGGHPLQKQYPPLGSAAAPTYTFTGDTNTGIYSPGADQVAISTNGTQRLLIKDASQDTLRVSGVNAVVTADAIGSNYPGFRLAVNGSILAGFDGDSGNSANLFTYAAVPLVFGIDSSERMRITSAGLVGIGTSAPNELLEVRGTENQGIRLTSTASSGEGANLQWYSEQSGDNKITAEIESDGSGTGGNLSFRTRSTAGILTDRVLIDNAGRLGVGTTSPTYLCNVIAAAGSQNIFQAGQTGVSNGYTITSNGTNLTHAWFNGGSEAARIDFSGRLGIGDSAPSTNFVLRGTGSSIAGVNAHFLVSDSTTAASGVGGSVLFEGNYTSGGARAAFGAIAGIKENGTDSNYAGSLRFYTRANGSLPALAMTIDSSQRVGIGTTTPTTLLEIKSDGTAANEARLTINEKYNASDTGFGVDFKRTYDTGGDAQDAGYIRMLRAGGNTNGGLTFGVGDRGAVSERLRIDSSGRLLIGTSSAVTGGTAQFSRIVALGNSAGATNPGVISIGMGAVPASGNNIGRIFFVDNAAGEYAEIAAQCDGTPGSGDYPGRLVFSTTADGASSPTERMRINNAGYTLLFGDNVLNLASSASAGTSAVLIDASYSATAVGTGTRSFIVYNNGNVLNTNNSYGSLSDVKLKENIIDAASQWSDIKALQVRNYNFKEGQTHTQIGLVAQEVELVSPGLVSESPDRDEDGNDLGTVTKSVNYSVLYMKAVKALQEAMERIEQLEAEMAEVKAQLS
jgi:hypothetical protein